MSARRIPSATGWAPPAKLPPTPLVLMSIAGRMSVEAELEPVTEVRDLALEDIEAEVGDAMTELRDVADGVKRMARDPFGTAGQYLAGPLLSILLKALKK